MGNHVDLYSHCKVSTSKWLQIVLDISVKDAQSHILGKLTIILFLLQIKSRSIEVKILNHNVVEKLCHSYLLFHSNLRTPLHDIVKFGAFVISSTTRHGALREICYPPSLSSLGLCEGSIIFLQRRKAGNFTPLLICKYAQPILKQKPCGVHFSTIHTFLS